MRRERLKDQIEPARTSAFDLIARSTLVLVATVAMFYAIEDLSRPRPPATQANATPGQAVASGNLTLIATRHHTFYWEKDGPIAVADFGPRLAAWLKSVRAPEVLVAADDSAELGDAMALFNEARRQGVAQVRIEGRTRPAPGSAPGN